MNSDCDNNIKSSSRIYQSEFVNKLNYVYTSRQCDEYLDYLEELRRIIFGQEEYQKMSPGVTTLGDSIHYHTKNGKTLTYRLENVANYGIRLASETETCVTQETVFTEPHVAPTVERVAPLHISHLPAAVEERMLCCLRSPKEFLSNNNHEKDHYVPSSSRNKNLHTIYSNPICYSTNGSVVSEVKQKRNNKHPDSNNRTGNFANERLEQEYAEDFPAYGDAEGMDEIVDENFAVMEEFASVLEESESVFEGVEDYTEDLIDYIVSDEKVESTVKQMHLWKTGGQSETEVVDSHSKFQDYPNERIINESLRDQDSILPSNVSLVLERKDVEQSEVKHIDTSEMQKQVITSFNVCNTASKREETDDESETESKSLAAVETVSYVKFDDGFEDIDSFPGEPNLEVDPLEMPLETVDEEEEESLELQKNVEEVLPSEMDEREPDELQEFLAASSETTKMESKSAVVQTFKNFLSEEEETAPESENLAMEQFVGTSEDQNTVGLFKHIEESLNAFDKLNSALLLSKEVLRENDNEDSSRLDEEEVLVKPDSPDFPCKSSNPGESVFLSTNDELLELVRNYVQLVINAPNEIIQSSTIEEDLEDNTREDSSCENHVNADEFSTDKEMDAIGLTTSANVEQTVDVVMPGNALENEVCLELKMENIEKETETGNMDCDNRVLERKDDGYENGTHISTEAVDEVSKRHAGWSRQDVGYEPIETECEQSRTSSSMSDNSDESFETVIFIPSSVTDCTGYNVTRSVTEADIDETDFDYQDRNSENRCCSVMKWSSKTLERASREGSPEFTEKEHGATTFTTHTTQPNAELSFDTTSVLHDYVENEIVYDEDAVTDTIMSDKSTTNDNVELPKSNSLCDCYIFSESNKTTENGQEDSETPVRNDKKNEEEIMIITDVLFEARSSDQQNEHEGIVDEQKSSPLGNHDESVDVEKMLENGSDEEQKITDFSQAGTPRIISTTDDDFAPESSVLPNDCQKETICENFDKTSEDFPLEQNDDILLSQQLDEQLSEKHPIMTTSNVQSNNAEEELETNEPIEVNEKVVMNPVKAIIVDGPIEEENIFDELHFVLSNVEFSEVQIQETVQEDCPVLVKSDEVKQFTIHYETIVLSKSGETLNNSVDALSAGNCKENVEEIVVVASDEEEEAVIFAVDYDDVQEDLELENISMDLEQFASELAEQVVDEGISISPAELPHPSFDYTDVPDKYRICFSDEEENGNASCISIVNQKEQFDTLAGQKNNDADVVPNCGVDSLENSLVLGTSEDSTVFAMIDVFASSISEKVITETMLVANTATHENLFVEFQIYSSEGNATVLQDTEVENVVLFEEAVPEEYQTSAMCVVEDDTFLPNCSENACNQVFSAALTGPEVNEMEDIDRFASSLVADIIDAAMHPACFVNSDSFFFHEDNCEKTENLRMMISDEDGTNATPDGDQTTNVSETPVITENTVHASPNYACNQFECASAMQKYDDSLAPISNVSTLNGDCALETDNGSDTMFLPEKEVDAYVGKCAQETAEFTRSEVEDNNTFGSSCDVTVEEIENILELILDNVCDPQNDERGSDSEEAVEEIFVQADQELNAFLEGTQLISTILDINCNHQEENSQTESSTLNEDCASVSDSTNDNVFSVQNSLEEDYFKVEDSDLIEKDSNKEVENQEFEADCELNYVLEASALIGSILETVTEEQAIDDAFAPSTSDSENLTEILSCNLSLLECIGCSADNITSTEFSDEIQISTLLAEIVSSLESPGTLLMHSPILSKHEPLSNINVTQNTLPESSAPTNFCVLIKENISADTSLNQEVYRDEKFEIERTEAINDECEHECSTSSAVHIVVKETKQDYPGGIGKTENLNSKEIILEPENFVKSTALLISEQQAGTFLIPEQQNDTLKDVSSEVFEGLPAELEQESLESSGLLAKAVSNAPSFDNYESSTCFDTPETTLQPTIDLPFVAFPENLKNQSPLLQMTMTLEHKNTAPTHCQFPTCKQELEGNDIVDHNPYVGRKQNLDVSAIHGSLLMVSATNDVPENSSHTQPSAVESFNPPELVETSSVVEEVSYFLTTACVTALVFAPLAESSSPSLSSDIIEDVAKYFPKDPEHKDESDGVP